MIDLVILAMSCVAAFLGYGAARVEVRDNMDQFINDLRRQGRWASWAAVINAFAAIATVCARLWIIYAANPS